jgi:hypothetical protein
MSIGTYSGVRNADVSLEDISVYYNYSTNRETSNNTMYQLLSSEVLEYCYLPDDDNNSISGNENILEGLYNMKLPAAIFNQIGIYTIFIRPKTVPTMVVDCSVLSALPTIKGILVDANSLADSLTSNNALQGYRVEYINSDGTKLRNVVRYVVTSNRVVPVSENVGNTSQKAIRYRFDDSGSLIFLQLTPSSSSDVKPNATPFIGNPGQTILLTNTYFSPLVIEVNMVENTLDTIMEIVAGEQVKNIENGIMTYYDKNRVITKQFNLFEIKKDVSDVVPLYEVREKRTNIETSEDFNNVIKLS